MSNLLGIFILVGLTFGIAVLVRNAIKNLLLQQNYIYYIAKIVEVFGNDYTEKTLGILGETTYNVDYLLFHDEKFLIKRYEKVNFEYFAAVRWEVATEKTFVFDEIIWKPVCEFILFKGTKETKINRFNSGMWLSFVETKATEARDLQQEKEKNEKQKEHLRLWGKVNDEYLFKQ